MAERKEGIGRNASFEEKGFYFGIDNEASLVFLVGNKRIDIKVHNFRVINQQAR